MSNKSYDGDPIDASWQSDLKDAQAKGNTVAATPKEDAGKEKTSVWPSALPRDPFVEGVSGGESKQSKVVKALVQFPGQSNDAIAEYVGCSKAQVRAVRHKVSVFVPPEDVSFSIPETPSAGKSGLVKYAARRDEAGFDSKRFEPDRGSNGANDKERDQTNAADGGADVDSNEICRRYYAGGESTAEIAAGTQLSEQQITGRLRAWKSTDGNERAELDAWPLELPKKALGPKQAAAFEYWLANPEADKKQVAEATDTTTRTVSRVRQRLRCYTTDSSGLPFDLPDEPSPGLAEHALDVYRQREGPLSADTGEAGDTDKQTEDQTAKTDHQQQLDTAAELREQLSTLSQNVEDIDSNVAERFDKIDERVTALEAASRLEGDSSSARNKTERVAEELQRRRQASVLTRLKWWLFGSGSE